MADEKVKQANYTRAQAGKVKHQQENEKRARGENELRVSYKNIKEEPALLDILNKARSFAKYHEKMAKDGVGFRETGQVDKNGNPIQETVFFDQNKRVTELDKAAGIEELLSYIERRISEEGLQQIKPKKVVADGA